MHVYSQPRTYPHNNTDIKAAIDTISGFFIGSNILPKNLELTATRDKTTAQEL